MSLIMNMKKLILSLLAVLALAVSANAQIGIVAGLTSSSTDVESAVANIKSVNQYHVGLSYRFKIGEVLAIQRPSFITSRARPSRLWTLASFQARLTLRQDSSRFPYRFRPAFLSSDLPVCMPLQSHL